MRNANFSKQSIILLVLAYLSISPIFADSYSPSFNYQGRILNASGSGPYAGIVDLKLDIYDPSGTCLLYEETQTGLDLITTDGAFSIQVGSPLSNTKRVSGVDPGLSMVSVFSNSGTSIRSAGANCPNGYVPSPSDARLLRVTVTAEDTQVSTVLSPDLVINTVPYATVADSIQGLGTSDFIRATGTVSNSAMTLLTSGGDATALHNHDSQYIKIGSSSSNHSFGMASHSTLGLGSFTTADQANYIGASTPAGSVWYNSDTKQTYFWDGVQSHPIASFNTSGFSPNLAVQLATDQLGLLIKGSSFQNSDLTEWQNSSGSVLAKMDASGKLTVNNLAISGGSPGANKVLASDASGNASWQTLASLGAGGGGGGGGGVTDVTANLPLSSSGGSTPAISIQKADASHDGYLAQADFANFSSKEPAISLGTSSQYFRGDKSWRSLSSDVLPLISGYGPINYSVMTGQIGIQGLSTLGSADYILAMDHSGSNVEYKNLVGTASQITVTPSAGKWTLSTPQNIATSSSPQFSGLTLSGLSTGVVRSNSSGVLSASALSSSDVITGLAYTPVNKAGDTMTGTLTVPSFAMTTGAGSSKVLTSDASGNATWQSLPAGNAGTVTGVTASAPISSSGGAAPNISITQSSSTTNGYLSSSDWSAFSSKQNALGYTPVNAAGDTMSGLLVLSGPPVVDLNPASKKYVDDINTSLNSLITSLSASTQPTLTFTSPLVNTSNNISINAASTNSNGYLTASDWNTFNNKQAALGYTPVNRAGDTMTGPLILPLNGMTAGTNQFVLSGGNVGIGTTNPGSKLDVAGTVSATSFSGSGAGLTGVNASSVAWSNVSSKPTTLSGYGITDAISSTLTSGSILLGNSSNAATATAMSGDVTINSSGVTSIGSNKVTNSQLSQMTANTLKGNNTAGTANATDLTASQVNTLLATITGLSGDVTATGAGGTASATVAKINGATLGTTTATDGNLLIGNTSQWVSTALSGDATLSKTGAVTLANSGVTASTYKSVTVDAKGRVTAGTNPTTLSGYGITDAISSTLTSGSILLGNASNVATATTPSGDVTINSSGVTSIGSNKVTNSQLSQMAANTLKGNNTAGTANATDLTASQVNTLLATITGLSGDVTATGAGGTASATVAKINGATLGTTTATDGNLLIGNTSQWVSTALSGDATLSKTGAVTLANSGVTASTYKSVTVDAKGRVTAGTNPTTLSGYGITDAATSASPTFSGNVTFPGTGIWNSSGNVGIGTTNPTSALQVAGTVTATTFSGAHSGNGSGLTNLSSSNFSSLANFTDSSSSADGITVTGGSNALFASTSISQAKSSASQNGYLSSADWSTFNSKASTSSPTFSGNVTFPGTGIWNSSGNLGIGTTNPSNTLDIGSNGGITFSGTGLYAGDKKLYESGDGLLTWLTNTGGSSAGFSIANQNGTVFYLSAKGGSSYFNTSGNVGIGTTSPQSKLDVNGGAAIGTYAGTISAPSNGLIVSGNVGIGTTSATQVLDIGSGNIQMGFKPFYSNPAIGSTANGSWSGNITLCSGNGYVISVTCWPNNSPFVACPTQINSSGQVSAYNCTGSAATIACSGVCANMR